MNHLDEGTIHAWLDGALDPTQAREVETHVAACQSCAALVAEARGFIAASSRILGALDDDRVNVIPHPVSPKMVPIAQPRRVRRTAPWLVGVAAVLVAAVVLRTTDASRARVMSESSALTAPVAAAGMDSATLPPQQVADAPAPAAPAIPSARESKVAAQLEAEASKSVANAPVPAEQTRMSAVAQSAPPQAKAEVGGVAGGASASAPADIQERSVATALALVDQGVAGCYRMDAASMYAPGVSATRTTASRRDERRGALRAAAPQAAPGAVAAADFASTTRLVRIDSASSDVARVARVLPSDSIVGTWRVAGDSIRVELSAGRTVSLARASRIVCP